MSKNGRLLWICGFFGLLASANAQTPPTSTAASTFDDIYRLVSTSNVNATYTDRNGQTAPCPNRRQGPLHIEHGQARYTNTTGYKLRGTVGPRGELAMGLVAPPNSSDAGSQPLNLSGGGQIDSTGTARVRQTSNSCSYDFVWQKEAR